MKESAAWPRRKSQRSPTLTTKSRSGKTNGHERRVSPSFVSSQPLRRAIMSDQLTPLNVVYKPIEGFPGYRVGDDGTVWSCRGRGRAYLSLTSKWRKLKPSHREGYLRVRLCRIMPGSYSYQDFSVHRLVLTEFVGPCPDEMQACHFPDPCRSNNQLCNLRWATSKENSDDKQIHGTTARGSRSGGAKLTEGDVREIRRRYIPRRYPLARLAREFGLNLNTVFGIITRKYWKHC